MTSDDNWPAVSKHGFSRATLAAGASANAAPAEVNTASAQAVGSGPDATNLLDRFQQRAALTERYVRVYQQYCRPVESIADLKLAAAVHQPTGLN